MTDFHLGPEWLNPIFMYAVTGKMLYIRRVNTEPKASLVVPLKDYEQVKDFAKFVGMSQKKGIQVTGRFLRPSSQEKQIIPLELPPGTKWQDITITFLDWQIVRITAPNLDTKVNYKEMGFQDDRTQSQNKQWDLLKLLAEEHGELSWADPQATKKIKQRKHLLSDALKAYFQIDEDPFFPYQREKSYKIKINLIPD